MLNSNGGKSEGQYVVFNLCGKQYCIGIESVVEIIRMESITKLPETPDFIEGVINLRGSVVVIMELCKKFNMPISEISNASRIIIVESQGRRLGMIVDSVSEVQRISDADIEAPPAMISAAGTKAIKAIALVKEQLVTVLDVENLLHSDEIQTLDEINLEA